MAEGTDDNTGNAAIATAEAINEQKSQTPTPTPDQNQNQNQNPNQTQTPISTQSHPDNAVTQEATQADAAKPQQEAANQEATGELIQNVRASMTQ